MSVIKIVIVAIALMGLSVSGAIAKEVRIAMGNFEPYFIAQGNTGIFADIVTAAFNEMEGIKPVFLFDYSLKQQLMAYEAGRADAIVNVFEGVEIDGCKTDLAFRFSDVIVSKVEEHRQINKLSDVKDLRIVAFEGAQIFFGPEYEGITNATTYQEVAKPNLQMRLLHAGRADVSVGDKYIFLDAARKSVLENTNASDFTFHKIFPQIESRMAFSDLRLCPKFNEALKKIKQSGEYEAIYTKYLEALAD